MEYDLTKAEQLVKDHRYEEALAVYEEAIRLSMPDSDPSLHYRRAAVLERLAEQAYKTAKQLGYDEGEQEEGTTHVEVAPRTMSLTTLTRYAAEEFSKFRRGEPSGDQYCLEIFRRALGQNDERAWDIVYALFQESVRQWFRGDASRTVALRHEDEQSYIDNTFKRFWQSVTAQHLEFPSLTSVLRYLRLCLNSTITDMLRTYARKGLPTLPEPGSPDDLPVEDSYHEYEQRSVVAGILTNERELRVTYLLYHCGLKPREILISCPGEFANELEIYRLKRNALNRLGRNKDKLLRMLSNETGY